jgi:outer membrane protein OmpA-like peptidoglycan-associated protein
VKTIHTIGLLVFLAGVGGCTTAVAPPELVTARTVYDRAVHGPTAQVDPADLHTAKESLDRAEQVFASDGDTQDTRDLCYIASRRTETAETRARALMAVAERDKIVAQMNASTTTQARLAAEQLARANQALAAQGAELQTQGVELQNEVQRRKDAEKRAAQAAADLARIASVKQEARGMVITLSGSVLFTSGSATLLPEAQLKLNDVADALTQQDPESKMVVEGYTDSQGSAASNQDLSQRRAKAVRDYLVSRGIAGDRITSEGFGPGRPVADNASAEGRANNRRVEIVVHQKP